MRVRSSTSRSSAATAPFSAPAPGPGPVWILTAQLKRIGPNIVLWAPRSEEGDEPPFLRQEKILGESRLGPAPMVLVENPRIVEGTSLSTLPEFRFIRRLTAEDDARLAALSGRENALLSFVRERASFRSLPMIFIESVGNFAANDFLLYYTAEGRVDFRELLKDIHAKYRGRIELRQISPREYTSLLDGVGACGKSLCCSTFLKSFRTISTRMAREMDAEPASLRSTGMCGRLKCCLSFELSPDGPGAEPEGEAKPARGCSSRAPASEWAAVSFGNEPASSSGASHPSSSRKDVRLQENRYRKEPRPRG